MNRATDSDSSAIDPLIVSLDVGSSSVRSLLYDARAELQTDVKPHRSYKPDTTADGGIEIDADHLLQLVTECLDELHAHLQERRLKPQAVGFSAFWHSFLGIDTQGKPTSPIYHLLDTRSNEQADKLRKQLNADEVHSRTGCVIHTSYWPAKLLWLAEEQKPIADRTARWLSFGEYLYLRLFGVAAVSSSMMSATGIWNQNQNWYDLELLKSLPVKESQLAPREELDQVPTQMLPEFAQRWPLLQGIPWLPAAGDGACSNVGTNATTRDRFCLMVGTTGAMRAVVEQKEIRIPKGLWCYRVDARRYVLGGALSNGGKVFEWMESTLQLPKDEELEAELAKLKPGEHGLTILPLFAGERSPGWRTDARAAFYGMSLHTRPIDLVRAALESVALRFRLIYDRMVQEIGHPDCLMTTGGGLDNSPVWTQMMADALGRTVTKCTESEASSRGAALLALEHIGVLARIQDAPDVRGESVEPIAGNQPAYAEMLDRMQSLYHKLFEEK